MKSSTFRNFCKLFKKSNDKIGINNKNLLETLKLSNGLEVLLVQNKNFQNSSILLTLDAGSIYDPQDVKGLAHLTENMIFQGSEKYLEKNELMNFIDQNFGYFNSSTSLEEMKFYFQIDQKSFEKACDILANALAKPVLNVANSSKENNFVDKKYRIFESVPSQRIFSRLLFDKNQGLPEIKTDEESKEILNNPKITEQVQEFHKKYFTSNRMKLVIASNLPLKNLIEISQLFNIIPKGKLKKDLNLPNNTKLNEKYEIESLVTEPTSINLSENLSSSMIMFDMKFLNNYLVVRIKIPSELSYFENKSMKYIFDNFNLNVGKFFNDEFLRFGFCEQFQKFGVMNEKDANYTISMKLTAKGIIKNNFVLEKTRDFFRTHKINKKLFELKGESEKKNLKSSFAV